MVGYAGNDTNLVLPESYNGDQYEIHNSAFSERKDLTSVTISSGVTSIGNLAFYNCSNLTNVIIGNSVTSIGNSAFSNCTNLTSIAIPDSVTSIGYNAFGNCSNLTSVTFVNTSGWWYTDNATATSGTGISATYLEKSATAAQYLNSTYSSKFWRCTK